MKIRNLISGLLAFVLAAPFSLADDGMWLPSLISSRIADMQANGFKLTAEDIYSVNQASLKDAVMLFGGGCSAELISGEGLLITNHHCGYGWIQRHSSLEHDYLKDGFWAKNRSEELPCPGMTVSFLDHMDDVTAAVLNGYDKSMNESQRDSIVSANSKRLIADATAAGNGLRASVEPMYYGNQYFIFVYRVYRDVRFVAAPPSSIGKFGGDTDNWMWPRHTGDFSMFRIYADKDNNPADYSKENVPYIPKKFLKVSLKGVQEGDFTMVYGFPGSTKEYIMSDGVRYIGEIGDPEKIALRTLRLDIQKKYMDADRSVKIQYSSKNASVSNAWKKWQGESMGIAKKNTVAKKQEFEKKFVNWAKGTEYEGLIPHLDSLYNDLEPYQYASDYYSETIRTVELVNFANSIVRLVSDEKLDQKALSEKLKTTAEGFFKDYYKPIDKDCFVAVMKAFSEKMPADQQPDFYKKMVADAGSIEALADKVFDSVFADEDKVKALTKEDLESLKAERAYTIGTEFSKWFGDKIAPTLRRDNQLINLAYRDYMRGQMEFCKDKVFYPDANLTLRVAYGKIKGYSPADGIYYYPSSTIEGIMQKDNPDIFDYNIPQRLRDIYAAKDYGRWDVNGSVPVCFIATNHTTGGNSGSPVLDAEGNLIGINFDRVWEGTMSDIEYDSEICRNICLDIRYAMFIIDKIGGASYLFDEMEFAD